MKKIFLFIMFCLLNFNLVLASDDLKSCFSLSSSLKVESMKNEIFLLNSSKNIDYALLQSDGVYYRYYNKSKEFINYKTNLSIEKEKFVIDNNKTTYIDFPTANNNFLLIDLGKEYSFLNFSFEADSNNEEIYISSDNVAFKKVYRSNLLDLSYRYLKIVFINENGFSKNVKIYDLSFEKVLYKYLVKSKGKGEYKFFSNFTCQNSKINNDLYSKYLNNGTNVGNFTYKNGLNEYNIDFSYNADYQIKNISDIDLDGFSDEEDNCKNDFNPTQFDSNGNGVGDACDDDDFDSILGKNDNCPFNTNPNQKDVNNNGVGDICEFDMDKDSIFDSKDNCINKKNSDQNDVDLDGIGDLCDNCRIYNPNQRDENLNNIGDTCEDEEKIKRDNDKDKDGVLDDFDNCKKIANKDQKDTDIDGIGDVCDNCLEIKNELQEDLNKNNVGDVCEDSDKDSIIGYLDNCINISNKDQRDSDNNGKGDVCEDSDGDNVINVRDNCPFAYNPDQKDVDSDNMGNSCDIKDNRYVESNKQFFIFLLSIITLFFIYGIYSMYNKLQKKEKIKNKK